MERQLCTKTDQGKQNGVCVCVTLFCGSLKFRGLCQMEMSIRGIFVGCKNCSGNLYHIVWNKQVKLQENVILGLFLWSQFIFLINLCFFAKQAPSLPGTAHLCIADQLLTFYFHSSDPCSEHAHQWDRICEHWQCGWRRYWRRKLWSTAGVSLTMFMLVSSLFHHGVWRIVKE